MPALSMAQSDVFDRLRIFNAERERIALERAALEERSKALAEREAAINAEESELLKQAMSGECADIPLVFDADGKTIRWAGGSVRLGNIPFRLLKELFHSKKQCLSVTRITKRVLLGSNDPDEATVTCPTTPSLSKN
jgi:DNA-binding response OmpR family regulator